MILNIEGIKFHNAKCRNYEFEKKWLFFEKTAGRGELPRPGSNKTKAFIEVYEKSNMAWKPKTKSFVLSEIIANN